MMENCGTAVRHGTLKLQIQQFPTTVKKIRAAECVLCILFSFSKMSVYLKTLLIHLFTSTGPLECYFRSSLCNIQKPARRINLEEESG